jgi:hypothetical protein
MRYQNPTLLKNYVITIYELINYEPEYTAQSFHSVVTEGIMLLQAESLLFGIV